MNNQQNNYQQTPHQGQQQQYQQQQQIPQFQQQQQQYQQIPQFQQQQQQYQQIPQFQQQQEYQQFPQPNLNFNPFANSNSNVFAQPNFSRSYHSKDYSNRSPQDLDREKQVFKDDEKISVKEKVKETNTTFPGNMDVESMIGVQVAIKNKSITASSFMSQTQPVVATISTDKITNSKKTSTDLVCVLDISGSMHGQKLELVKKTFNQVVKYLDENDRLSIVVFDNKSDRITPLMRMTEENKDKTLQMISKIQSRGGTAISTGIQLALDILKSRRYINSVTSIFVLSDGQDGNAMNSSWVERSAESNLTIHTFGYGSDHDPDLMTEIAKQGTGNFYFIDKYETVDEAFVDCLGSLVSTVAKDIEIQINTIDNKIFGGVEISKVFGDDKQWKKTDKGGYKTSTTYLISGRTKDYVMEITFPKINAILKDEEKKIQILDLVVKMKGVDDKLYEKKAKLEVTIFNEGEDGIDEEINKEVLKQFYRVKGAESLDQARKLADQGKNEDAQKFLNNIQEELENCAVKNEEFIKNLIKDIKSAIDYCAPKNYAEFGRHNMIGNANAQMQQQSYMQSANWNCYANNVQQGMVFEAQNMKKKF